MRVSSPHTRNRRPKLGPLDADETLTGPSPRR